MSVPVDLNELTAAIDAQLQAVSELIDPYVDLQAEHHGEVARFGDSWPGAVEQISNAGAALHHAQETLWDLIAHSRRPVSVRRADLHPRRRRGAVLMATTGAVRCSVKTTDPAYRQPARAAGRVTRSSISSARSATPP